MQKKDIFEVEKKSGNSDWNGQQICQFTKERTFGNNHFVVGYIYGNIAKADITKSNRLGMGNNNVQNNISVFCFIYNKSLYNNTEIFVQAKKYEIIFVDKYNIADGIDGLQNNNYAYAVAAAARQIRTRTRKKSYPQAPCNADSDVRSNWSVDSRLWYGFAATGANQ